MCLLVFNIYNKTNYMHRKNKKFRKIGLIASTSENKVLSSLIISSTLLLIEVQKRNFISCASCGIFTDLFSKLRSNKEGFENIVHHRAINRGQYGLFF